MPDNLNVALSKNIHEELPLLFADLRKFRMTLSESDRGVFDRVWGLSESDDSGDEGTFFSMIYKRGQDFRKFVVRHVTKTKSRTSALFLLDTLKLVLGFTL
jgi:hypothetical protein